MSGVLHVCLTNLSRSPMAEAIMRAQLREALGTEADAVSVSSAGLAAHPGAPIDARSGAELKRRGLELPGFGAQPLSRSAIAAADLVLTATRAQRDEVSAVLPAALFRTFTLRELAILLHGVEPSRVPGVTAAERTRALAEIATRRRRILTPPPGEQLDIPQSWGHNPLRYRKLARQIEEPLAVLVELIVPPIGTVVPAPLDTNFLPAMRSSSDDDLAALEPLDLTDVVVDPRDPRDIRPDVPLSSLGTDRPGARGDARTDGRSEVRAEARFDATGARLDGRAGLRAEDDATGPADSHAARTDAATAADASARDAADAAGTDRYPPHDVEVFDTTPPMGVPNPLFSPPAVVQLPPDVVQLPEDDAVRAAATASPRTASAEAQAPAAPPSVPPARSVRPSAPGWPATGGVRPVSGITPELAAETAAAIDAVLTRARRHDAP